MASAGGAVAVADRKMHLLDHHFGRGDKFACFHADFVEQKIECVGAADVVERNVIVAVFRHFEVGGATEPFLRLDVECPGHLHVGRFGRCSHADLHHFVVLGDD